MKMSVLAKVCCLSKTQTVNLCETRTSRLHEQYLVEVASLGAAAIRVIARLNTTCLASLRVHQPIRRCRRCVVDRHATCPSEQVERVTDEPKRNSDYTPARARAGLFCQKARQCRSFRHHLTSLSWDGIHL